MSKRSKIIFAGTPEFALPTLAALDKSQNGYQIAAVLTQPDRPAGRGRRGQQRELRASPIKQYALANELPLLQPVSLRNSAIQQQLQQLDADLMIVVAYGLILPAKVLNIPHIACLNVHASLLPRWRGAAPIQRALLAGDEYTGISIMHMDAGLDTGAVYQQQRCAITADMTAADLHDKLAQLGADTLLECLPKIVNQQLSATPQDSAQATYADKLQKDEAELDWQQPASYLDRCIRAFKPWPTGYTFANNDRLLIHRAQPADNCSVNSQDTAMLATPGQVVAENSSGIYVVTGAGYLRITELQIAGRRRQTAIEFLQARSLRGMLLGSVA